MVTTDPASSFSEPTHYTYDQANRLIGRVYAWDPENRLTQANVTGSASPTGFGLVASYQYDALGRRVAKTWAGQTTRYLCAGAQVIEERDRTPIPSQANITGTSKDGSLANASLTPAPAASCPRLVTARGACELPTVERRSSCWVFERRG